MSEERWEERYEREAREATAKAKKAWETKYKRLTPLEKNKEDTYTEYVFDEGTVTTDKAELVKTTRFRVMKDGEVYMSKLVNKSQLFLVVSGPLKGKRIKHDYSGKHYVLFNRNGRYGKNVPKCVLVHVGDLTPQ